ncbi:hypothetical protein IT157_06160 [bacterium]|nr:hypothetical protein [bacterium]
MKKYLLLAGLVALVASLFASDFVKKGDEYVYEDTLTFDRDAADFTRLEIETVNGGIIVQSWDVNSIHIVAYRSVRCEKSETGRKFVDKFEPVVKERGSSLVIETKYPKRGWGDEGNEAYGIISYLISAPRGLSVEAETVNGGVEIFGMNGEMELASVNGAIDVEAEEGLTGRANLSTVNGSVELLASVISGKSKLESVNGGIDLKITSALNGDVSLSTVNGGIEITLPQTSDVRLTAEVAMSGGIESDWGSVNEGSMFGESLDFTSGTGEHRVSLESVNGSIEIRAVKAN